MTDLTAHIPGSALHAIEKNSSSNFSIPLSKAYTRNLRDFSWQDVVNLYNETFPDQTTRVAQLVKSAIINAADSPAVRNALEAGLQPKPPANPSSAPGAPSCDL